MAYHWRWLVKWVHKLRLIWWKCFPADRLEWLLIKHSITLSMLTSKARLTGEGGFSLGMAYQLNYVFPEYKLGRSPISRVASCRGLTVLLVHSTSIIAVGLLYIRAQYNDHHASDFALDRKGINLFRAHSYFQESHVPMMLFHLSMVLVIFSRHIGTCALLALPLTVNIFQKNFECQHF